MRSFETQSKVPWATTYCWPRQFTESHLWLAGKVQVVVVPTRDRGRVVHAAAVVGAPAFGESGAGPELPLPDEVFDAEFFRVGVQPVGGRPVQGEGGPGGLGDDGGVERSDAGAAEGVLGGLPVAWGVAGPGRAAELLTDLGEHSGGAFGDLPVGGGVIDHAVGVRPVVRRRITFGAAATGLAW